MLEKEYDKKVISSLINLYKEIENEINLLGEDSVKEHSPGLIQRKETIRGIIVKYAQIYCKGYANAERMSMNEIEEIIRKR